jgi:pentatricopeptide repeat protein
MPVRQLQPNAFSYAAVIQAHCVSGDVRAAWQRLREMRQAQLPITAATLRPFLKLGTSQGPWLGELRSRWRL